MEILYSIGNNTPQNWRYEDAKIYFNEEIKGFISVEGKINFIKSHLEQTNKAIKNLNDNPDLLALNKVFYEGGLLFRKFLQDELNKLEPAMSETKNNLQKLRWLGNPEQFGYIFGELASKGYLELPTQQGEGAFSVLAELCLKYFDIEVSKGKTKGKQTTKENLERALNPETNKLSVKGQAAMELPPLSDLK